MALGAPALEELLSLSEADSIVGRVEYDFVGTRMAARDDLFATTGGDWTYLFRGRWDPEADDYGAQLLLDPCELCLWPTLHLQSDLDGDGAHELVVGGEPNTFSWMYAYSADLTGTASTADAWLEIRAVSLATTVHIGQTLADGDLDGDGVAELLVSHLQWPAASGEVRVWSSPSPGAYDASAADARLVAPAVRDHSSDGIASMDLDGDGFDDVLVGSPQGEPWGIWSDSGPGRVDAWPGPVVGAHDLTLAPYQWVGPSTEVHFGSDLSCPGDLDGDGHDDLVVASLEDIGNGPTYILHGPFAPGKYDLDDSLEVRMDATSGAVHSPAGDLDGDGTADLLVAAEGYLYVLLGPL